MLRNLNNKKIRTAIFNGGTHIFFAVWLSLKKFRGSHYCADFFIINKESRPARKVFSSSRGKFYAFLDCTKAQAVMGEYALVIFLVIAVMTSMTIFFKRAVQARIHDARDYMTSEVPARVAGAVTGNIYKEYEPYYANTDATVFRTVDDTIRVLPAASSGIFLKEFNETTNVRVDSTTAPPRDFDLTTPTN